MPAARVGLALAIIPLLIACFARVGWAGPARVQLAQKWDDLSPGQQQKALKNYQRYKKLPESDRQQIDRSYQNWRGMDSSERNRIRQNYDAYRQMSPDKRREIDDRYKRQKGKQH